MKKIGQIILTLLLCFFLGGITIASEETRTEVKSTELPELRTAFSKTYQKSDGTYTTIIYQNLIHFTKDGKWQEINPQLVKMDSLKTEVNLATPDYFAKNREIQSLQNESYIYSTPNNIFQLHFAELSGVPLKLEIDENWLTFQPLGVNPVKGQFYPDYVLYRETWKNSDLLYISETKGLKEYIILKTSDHPAEFVFSLQLCGLFYYQDEAGTIIVKDASGEVKAYIPKGFMQDANGECSDQVEMRLEEQGENIILTLIPDREWLESDKRKYPVEIDPPLYYDYTKILQDAYVTSYGFSSKHGTEKRLEVGNNKPLFSNKTTQHSLLKFHIESTLATAGIISAKVKLFMFEEIGEKPATISTRKIQSPWSESTVCWNNMPNSSEIYKIHQVDEWNQHYTFELNPLWINEWALNASANYGFYLYSNTNEEENLKYFYSREAEHLIEYRIDPRTGEDVPVVVDNDPNKLPRLEINYTDIPVTPRNFIVADISGIYISDGITYTRNQPIKLKWDIPTGTVTGYQLYLNDQEILSSITQNEFNLDLPVEGNYKVQVKALGEGGFSGPLSQPLNLVIDRTVSDIQIPSVIVGADSVLIDWTDLSKDASGIAGYQISLTNNLTPPVNFDLTPNLTVSEVTYTNLSSKLKYYLWVRGIDKVGNSGRWISSPEFSFTPKQSEILTIQAQSFLEIPNYRVILEIKDVSTAQYVIYRRLIGQTQWSELVTRSDDWMVENNFTFIDQNSLSKHRTYEYKVKTRNLTGLQSNESLTKSVTIPNIRAGFVVSPENDILTKNPQITVDLKEKTDIEGDLLKYSVVYRKKGGIWKSSPKTDQPTAINLELDGEWEWYVEITEYDANREVETYRADNVTGWPRRVIVDTKPPMGNFAILALSKDNEYVERNMINTDNLRLKFSGIIDPDSGSGVKRICLWNGAIEPEIKYHLADVVDPLGYYIIKNIDEIKNGTIGVIIEKTENPDQIPWVISAEDGLKVVHMLIEDRAGNIFHSERSIIVDRQVPSTPENFTHSPEEFGLTTPHKMLTINWETIDNTNEISGFIGTYEITGVQVDFTASVISKENNKAKGTLSIDVSAYNANTEVKISVSSIDNAGNISTPGMTNVFTKAKLGQIGNLISGYNQQTQKRHLQWELTDIGTALTHILEYGYLHNGEFEVESHLNLTGNGKFIHGDLLPHASHYYRLVALNGSKDKTYGTVFSATVANNPPTSPVNVCPSQFAGSSVNFTYSASKDLDLGDNLTYTVYLGSGNNPANCTPLAGESITGLLHNQTYTWYVEVKDDWGGSAKSVPQQFVVDTIMPTVVLAELAEPFSNQQKLDLIISDDLSGIKDNKAIVIIDGTPFDIVLTTGADGKLHGVVPLKEGAYLLEIFVYDQAQNQAKVSKNLRIDRTAPNLSNVSLALNQSAGCYVTPNNFIKVHFEVSDPIFGNVASKPKNLLYWFLTTQGEETGSAGTVLAVSPNIIKQTALLGLPDKNNHTYYLALALEDMAGNRSTVTYYGRIYIDQTAPEVSVVLQGTIKRGGTHYLTNLFDLTVKANAVDEESKIKSLTYTIVSAESGNPLTAWGDWATVKMLSLQAGSAYRVKVKAVNGVGAETIVQTDQFIFDNTKPSNLSLTVPVGELISGETAVFTLKATDETPLIKYRLAIGSSVGATDLTELVSDNINGWLALNPEDNEYRLLLPQVPNGVYYPTFEATNAAGLTATLRGSSFKINNTQERVVVNDYGQYTFYTDRLGVNWQYAGLKNVASYRYRIIGGDNLPISGWQVTDEREVTVTNLILQTGRRYYFEVQAIYTDGSYSASGFSQGCIVDPTGPEVSIITPEFATSQNLTFSWQGSDPESGIRKVQVTLGSNYYLTDITKGWLVKLKMQVLYGSMSMIMWLIQMLN